MLIYINYHNLIDASLIELIDTRLIANGPLGHQNSCPPPSANSTMIKHNKIHRQILAIYSYSIINRDGARGWEVA